jgi:hypothetical protein
MAEAEKTSNPASITDAILAALKALAGDSLKGLIPTKAIEGSSFYGTITAYRALDAVAEDVSKLIQKNKLPSVLICSSFDLPDLVAYRALVTAAEILLTQIDNDLEQKSEKPLETEILSEQAQHIIDPATVTAVISAGLGLASFLLHRETKEVNYSLTFDVSALNTLVERKLINAGINVAEPALLAFALTDTGITPAEGRLRGLLTNLEKQGDRLRAVSSETKDLSLKARLEALLKEIAVLEEASNKNLSQLIRGDEIAAFLKQQGACILSLQILAAGGSTRTVTRWGPDPTQHSGGVVVGARILNPEDNKIIDSQIFIKNLRFQENDNQLDKIWNDDGL